MKILQIGAGSMGTRRLRDLLKLGMVEVALFDERDDRRKQAAERFRIRTFDSLPVALQWKPEALCISTPPQAHREFVELALERGLHHFCEANIWTPDSKRVETVAGQKKLVAAPSSSFHFLPLVRELKRMVRDHLGALHSYQFCLSTYLPTWHPGEGREYYARNRGTAAAREMVPFELAWLNHVFAAATHVRGRVMRRGILEGVPEDLWALQMDLARGGVGQLTVLMGSEQAGSEQAYRKGHCVGTHGIVEFDLTSGRILRHSPCRTFVETVECGPLASTLENAYAEEISTFVHAIDTKTQWPYSYHDSAIATATLAACEKSSRCGEILSVVPAVQPGAAPDDYESNIIHRSSSWMDNSRLSSEIRRPDPGPARAVDRPRKCARHPIKKLTMA